MTVVYLALGSNVGDREGNLEKARQALQESGARILRGTEVEETEPFGVTAQPRFLNQVLEVEWSGSARQLLEMAKAVERKVGRTETFRWGPREIDVDILVFGDQAISEPDLEIPHPGIRERHFVREPLLRLRPDLASILEA